jgi:hypothetical protein
MLCACVFSEGRGGRGCTKLILSFPGSFHRDFSDRDDVLVPIAQLGLINRRPLLLSSLSM